MKSVWLGVAGMCLTGVALAAGPAAVRKTAQVSMMVTGSITVAPDGTEQGYVIDHGEQLPASVVSLIAETAPHWKFEPLLQDGHPVLARAPMSLRIVAKPVGDGDYSLTLSGAHFGRSGSADDEDPSYKSRHAPRYPELSIRMRASGTVYALMRINRQGQVIDAAVEQVNLGVYGSDIQMRLIRKDLSLATLDAIKHWTFNTPTRGRHADDPYWDVRVPVVYSIGPPPRTPKYGQWQAYIPGPQESVPWLKQGQLVAGGADLAVDGSISSLQQGLHLTTPVGGS